MYAYACQKLYFLYNANIYPALYSPIFSQIPIRPILYFLYNVFLKLIPEGTSQKALWGHGFTVRKASKHV